MELFFQVLHQGIEWIARSPQPKVILNVLLIKCATAEALFSLESTLPKALSSAAPAPSRLEAAEIPATVLPTASLPNSNPSTAPREKSWEEFIQHVRKTRPLLASILEHASCLGTPQGNSNFQTLAIHFSPGEAYFREQLLSRAYQEQLGQLSKEFFGNTVRLQIELKDTGESMAAKKEREQKERHEAIRVKAQNHPILLEAKSLFGGELGPIDVREPNHAELSP
jgi:hypothetical protein